MLETLAPRWLASEAHMSRAAHQRIHQIAKRAVAMEYIRPDNLADRVCPVLRPQDSKPCPFAR